jgi:hypothetical protein
MFGKQPLITASTPDAHKGMQTETRHCYSPIIHFRITTTSLIIHLSPLRREIRRAEREP